MQTIIKFIKSLFLIDLLKGLWVTLKYTPQPAFTFQYPAERRPTAPRFRGVLRLQTEPGTGAIFFVTVPATIIRSDCRGEARNTSAPKRAMSKRDADAAIISMAQQARPNVIGHMLDSRAQLIACSRVVVITLSSKRPSSHPIPKTPAPPRGV